MGEARKNAVVDLKETRKYQDETKRTDHE